MKSCEGYCSRADARERKGMLGIISTYGKSSFLCSGKASFEDASRAVLDYWGWWEPEIDLSNARRAQFEDSGALGYWLGFDIRLLSQPGVGL